MRILIVDDNYINRLQIRSLLAQYGECDAVPNAQIALEMFRIAHDEAVPYDLITMDVRMPDMDGMEAVRRIRDWERDNNACILGSEAKILMVSAADSGTTIFRAFRKGAEGYVVKPLTREKLREALRELQFVID